MSATNARVATQQKWTVTFYWIGITMSVLCIALSWARNTELLGRFEQADFPLSWAAGVIAIVAFLASEYCHPAPPPKQRAVRPFPEAFREPSTWETEFAD
jgi:hypothetical protein